MVGVACAATILATTALFAFAGDSEESSSTRVPIPKTEPATSEAGSRSTGSTLPVLDGSSPPTFPDAVSCSLSVGHGETPDRFVVVVSVLSGPGGLPVQLQVAGNNYASPKTVDEQGRAEFSVASQRPGKVVAVVGDGNARCDGYLI